MWKFEAIRKDGKRLEVAMNSDGVFNITESNWDVPVVELVRLHQVLTALELSGYNKMECYETSD